MLEQASSIATIADIIIKYVAPVIGLVGGSGGIIAYRNFHKAKEDRLYQNIKRPFAVISTEQQTLIHEVDLLERTKFLKPQHFGDGGRDLQLIDDIKPRLLVVGYSPNSATYKRAFAYARTHSLPLVVFAPKYQITDPQELAEVKQYSFSSLCQTELRLVSDIFSIMSTFPENK
jgi:hypothetical protein